MAKRARSRATTRSPRRPSRARTTRRGAAAPRRWVRRVAETSDAMDLPRGLFTRPPRAIAQGLRRSVMASRRTKGTKFQSAMSMLNLFINRSGRTLGRAERARLEAARDELRRAFGRLRGRCAA